MGDKISRPLGAVGGTFLVAVTAAKAPFWAIYQGVPLGVASIFSKRARGALASSFDEHFVRPLGHHLPAMLSGEMLDDWEKWDGWSRLHEVLWPPTTKDSPAGSPKPHPPTKWPVAPDLYQALGIMPTASPQDVIAAYRAAVKNYHPDVSKHPDAVRIIVEVNKAYAVLGDADLRRGYDLLYFRRQGS